MSELLPKDKPGQVEIKKEGGVKIMGILQYPDPILTTPCQLVTVFDDELMNFIGDMWATMRGVSWGKPVGLAAPQVGRSIQLFIANGEVFINPKLLWLTKAPRSSSTEGCYSKDANTYVTNSRVDCLRLGWQDEHGVKHERRFNGFKAWVIQHEYEHLNIGNI